MLSTSLPRLAAMFLVAILFVPSLPVEASHGQDLHVSAVTAGPFAASAVGHAVTFTVTNNGAATWDKITVSTNAATETLKVTGAAATGWVAGTPSDSDSPADLADTVVLTGGTLAAAASVVVTLNFDATAASTPTVTVTGDVVASSNPQSQAFTLTTAAAALVVSKTSLSLTEPSTTDTLTVRLAARPAANVEVGFDVPATHATATATVGGSSRLTFTPANWNTAQSVTVVPVNDYKDTVADRTATLKVQILDATSSDEYDAVADASLSVAIVDTDAPAIIVKQINAAGAVDTNTIVYEGGASDRLAINLATYPDTATKLSVALGATGQGRVTLTPAELTFTPTNGITPQFVTIAAVEDTTAEARALSVTITVAVMPGQVSAEYASASVAPVIGTVVDNDPYVLAAPSAIDVLEGEQALYTLSLTIQPTQDVTVAIEPGDGATTDVTTVVFTTANWNAARQVIVSIPDDALALGNRTVSIAHRVTAEGNYLGAAGQAVKLNVEDDDKIDIPAQNQALQNTVTVKRADGRNTVQWDLSVVDETPAGIQIWRADSPFMIIASAAEGTSTYRASSYTDATGGAESRYVVTVYYAANEERGYFQQSTGRLERVGGYTDQTPASLESFGVAAASDDDTDLLIAGIVVGLLVIVLIVILVIVLVRRQRRQEASIAANWDQPASAQPWAAGSDEPAATGAWAEQPEAESGWDAPADAAWEQAPAWEAGEAEPEPMAPAWPEHRDARLETFHLTCPRCNHDFSVQGHKPLETECPSCGVAGVLR